MPRFGSLNVRRGAAQSFAVHFFLLDDKVAQVHDAKLFETFEYDAPLPAMVSLLTA